ncbi:ComEC/Rec2 family competence protein, partial [Nitrospira defluvii]|nr:ComEC/Rec2 family competence protein [Nitrospira defluvii]
MSERPLVAVTLALLAGVFLGEAFSYFPLTITLLTLSLFFLEGYFYRSPKLPFSFFLVGVSAFLFIYLTSRPVSNDDLRWFLDKGPIRIIAEVSEPPRISPRHISFRMEAIEILSNHETQPVKGVFQLNIWRKDVPYRYGDRLDIRIRLRRPRQFQNIGVFQYADYRERIGWRGVANLSDLSRVKKVGEGGNPILKQIFMWRDEIRNRILSSVKMPQAALLMAVVIGEPAYLTDEVRETFTGSGVAHLLAVSGAHLAFVSLFIFGFTRWVILRFPEAILLRISVWKLPSQWAALVTGCAALFYTGLAGAKIGILRALTMILVYLISIWIGRRKDALISLSVAALLMILSQPRAVFELSFQLSFLAVLSIIMFIEWWLETGHTECMIKEPPSIQKQIANRVRPFFLSTIAATLGTAPITLYYFHQFSWSGLIANPILLPLAGWVMVPFGLFSAVLSLFLEEGFA